MDDLLDDHVDLFIAVPLDQVDKQAIFMRLFINIVLGTAVRQDARRKVKAPSLALCLCEYSTGMWPLFPRHVASPLR